MKPMIYLAHPVTGDPVGNAKKASAWIRWLTLNDPGRLYVAPWVAEVEGFSDETFGRGFYQHVLDDDAEVVSRCDGLLAVGGEWSNGMLQERAVARILDKTVLDLTIFTEPPTSEGPAAIIRERLRGTFPGYDEEPLGEDTLRSESVWS